jgi:hypothetical protein
MKPLKFLLGIFIFFFIDILIITILQNLLIDIVLLGFQFMLLFVVWLMILYEHS